MGAEFEFHFEYRVYTTRKPLLINLIFIISAKNVDKEYFFQLFKVDQDFMGAQTACKGQGGFLASIRDENDIKKILGLMAK